MGETNLVADDPLPALSRILLQTAAPAIEI